MTATRRLRKRLQRDCNMHPEVAALVVNTIVDELRMMVTDTAQVTIQYFGTFQQKLRKARLGQKFSGYGQHIPGGVKIPARMELKFTPCPEISQAIAIAGAHQTGSPSGE